jgi:hypothetical protein
MGGTASVPSHFFLRVMGPNDSSAGTEAVPPTKGRATGLHGEHDDEHESIGCG